MDEPDRAHAELHYGKYSAGYNRGYTRGAAERFRCHTERAAAYQILRELLDLNAQCDGDLLPSEYITRIIELVS